MTRIVIDDVLREKLLELQGSAELCDASGRVLACVVPPTPRQAIPEDLTPPVSEEEIERVLASTKFRFGQ